MLQSTIELHAVYAALIGFFVTAAVLPLVVRIAHKTNFLDQPQSGYKRHEQGTPYLGGTAVMAGVLVAALILGSAPLVVPIVVAIAWMLGTIDDRVNLGPKLRILIVLLCASALWLFDASWNFGNEYVDFTLTVLWVLGIVNAWNLMDNMDGAVGTIGSITAIFSGAMGIMTGRPGVAVLGFALAGACMAFLRLNLQKPSKIFLGDGGSMPIGLLLAWLTMTTVQQSGNRLLQLFAAGLLVGLPILDVALVCYSRKRGGRPLAQGGRDHLTHRIAASLDSPFKAIVVLAIAQTALGTLALIGKSSGVTLLAVFGAIALTGGAIVIAWLEHNWLPNLSRRLSHLGRIPVHTIRR